jgi:5-methylcytosine-specific restriction endonuclease McrA
MVSSKEYFKEYKQRPEVKEHRKEYYQRPEVKEKAKEYNQRPEIKEKAKEYRKEYQQKPENKEKLKEYQQKYRQKPKTKHRIKEYYQKNKEKKAEYYQENKEIISKRGKIHRQTPEGHATATNNRYKRRKAISETPKDKLVSTQQLKELYEKAIICPHCKHEYDETEAHRKSLDHIFPLSKGGWHTLGNLKIICKSCNNKKYNNMLSETINRPII